MDNPEWFKNETTESFSLKQHEQRKRLARRRIWLARLVIFIAGANIGASIFNILASETKVGAYIGIALALALLAAVGSIVMPWSPRDERSPEQKDVKNTLDRMMEP